jgi:hypothetical protein
MSPGAAQIKLGDQSQLRAGAISYDLDDAPYLDCHDSQ